MNYDKDKKEGEKIDHFCMLSPRFDSSVLAPLRARLTLITS